MAACQQIQEQRHDRTENNHADPEHHGMRTADQSFCTGSGTGKRGTQSNVDKGKNGEQFCNFNPEGSSSAPANGIRIDPFMIMKSSIQPMELAMPDMIQSSGIKAVFHREMPTA